MKVYVVVPVRNRKMITRRFLECLSQQTYRNRETILIDDGSTDGTGDMVRAEFPEVTYLAGDGNLWWTGGVNKGLDYVLERASDDDAILIINDDLEFDSDYLEILHRAFIAHQNAIVGSVVVDINDPERVHDGGRMINWWTAKNRLLNRGANLRAFHECCLPVSTLTGRGVLFPVRVFRTVGLYDSLHFQHRGDTELPIRAKRAGYELLVCYDAVVRSHVDNTYAIDIARYYGFGDIGQYFFDLRSSGRIKFRYYFALKTMQNPIQFICYLLCDLCRVAVHFLRRFNPMACARG